MPLPTEESWLATEVHSDLPRGFSMLTVSDTDSCLSESGGSSSEDEYEAFLSPLLQPRRKQPKCRRREQ